MSIERLQHKISFVSLNASNDYSCASKDPYCKHIMHMSLFINNHTFVFIHNFLTLTYWGRVTHVCVGKLTIICSDNGLSSGRRQAGILLIEPLGTIFSEILIGIQIFSLNKMRLKMSSAKWRPFCLGLYVLRPLHHETLFCVVWLHWNLSGISTPTAP